MPAPAVPAAVSGAVVVIAKGGKWVWKGGKWVWKKTFGKKKPDQNRVTAPQGCTVGKHSNLTCKSGYEGHHIIPDYTMYPSSPIKSSTRLSQFVSRGQAPAICLKGNGASNPPTTPHAVAQNGMKVALEALKLAKGANKAPIGEVIPLGTASIAPALKKQGMNPKDITICLAKVSAALLTAYGGVSNQEIRLTRPGAM